MFARIRIHCNDCSLSAFGFMADALIALVVGYEENNEYYECYRAVILHEESLMAKRKYVKLQAEVILTCRRTLHGRGTPNHQVMTRKILGFFRIENPKSNERAVAESIKRRVSLSIVGERYYYDVGCNGAPSRSILYTQRDVDWSSDGGGV